MAGLRSPVSIGLHNAMIDGGSIHGSLRSWKKKVTAYSAC